MNSPNNILLKYRLPTHWQVSVTTLILILLMCLFNTFKITSYTKVALRSLKGNEAYKNNYWGEAGIFYRQASIVWDGHVDLPYNLANAYYQQGRYDEAAQLYERLLRDKNNVNDAGIWNNLGNTYYMKGLLNKSFAAYKNALLLNDEDDVVRQNFLLVTIRLNQLADIKNRAKRGKDNKAADGTKNKDTKQDNSDGQQETDDQSMGPYQVSDKQMNKLLKISKDQEHVPKRGEGNNKDSRKTYLNGPDY